MYSKSQKQFLHWAKSKDERWPEVKKGKFKISLLDEAIQEGLAHYLQKEDITPLRRFLESAAKSVSGNDGEQILAPRLAIKGLPANQGNRAEVLTELCNLYGFLAEYESGWRTCVESGLDSDASNYLVFGIHCQGRRFGARQAHYFHSLRPPLTDAGRKQKAEIYPLVEEELKAFESQEHKNLFDFYLDIGQAIYVQCSVVPDLEQFKELDGRNLFARGKFQDRILGEFQRQFTAGLSPFEERLRAVFDDPDGFLKAKEQAFAGFKTDLIYPIRQKREFLSRHFYEVCTSGEKFGLRVDINSLTKVYRGGQHQVFLPFFPALIRNCMERHIAKSFRNSEDRFRKTLGLKGVGQGWISEATLLAYLRKEFPEEVLVHHARPKWLGRQHLDGFFPQLNIAVEYQGTQHQRPVSIFGGESGFEVRKHLDRRKRELCEAHGCQLIEVFPCDPMEPIVAKIRAIARKSNAAAVQQAQSSAQIRETIESVKALPLKIVALQTKKRPARQSWKRTFGKDDLAACARYGDTDLIFRLAEQGVDLKRARHFCDRSLLFVACEAGNLATATALLDVGVDPNDTDNRKVSVLSKLCNGRHIMPQLDIVRLLLERGADPNLHGNFNADIFGRYGYAFPMNGCAIDCFYECALTIFKHIGNVNQQQTGALAGMDSLMTPLMFACHPKRQHQYEHRSLQMIRWLVESGADLQMQSRIGDTPMDFALGATNSRYLNVVSISRDDIASREILQFLWNAGARPSERFKPILDLAFEQS